MTAKLPHPVRAHATAYLELASLAEAARAVEWDAPHSPKAREDSVERAKGIVSDPTATTALDPTRLALRKASDDAAEALAASTAELEKATAALREALEKFGF